MKLNSRMNRMKSAQKEKNKMMTKIIKRKLSQLTMTNLTKIKPIKRSNRARRSSNSKSIKTFLMRCLNNLMKTKMSRWTMKISKSKKTTLKSNLTIKNSRKAKNSTRLNPRSRLFKKQMTSLKVKNNKLRLRIHKFISKMSSLSVTITKRTKNT